MGVSKRKEKSRDCQGICGGAKYASESEISFWQCNKTLRLLIDIAILTEQLLTEYRLIISTMQTQAVIQPRFNRRAKAKENTRKLLLRSAKQLFTVRGFLQTKTVDITEKAKVAHGTLFLHFGSKESLILEIFDQELLKITDRLYHLLKDAFELEDLLEIYLTFLEREEPFFSVIAREAPFYDAMLRRQILMREAAIRHYLHQAIQEGIEGQEFKNVDITTALSFLFGSLNYFLSMKSMFVSRGSVIKEKKDSIKKTFLHMLRRQT